MAHASDAALPSAGPPKLTEYENTYITTPEGHGQALVWREHKVKLVLKAALQERIAGQVYDPITGTQVAKQLAEELRERIAGLGFKRHKLIVQVTLAQRTGQAMRLASKCLWDVSSDGSVSESYTNDSLYCICEVFGLYYE